MKKNHKIIAIIGGMGSASSLFLQEKILQTAVLTKKMESDGDYPDIIHLSLPSGIPDRSDFLLDKGASNPALIVHDFLTGLDRMAEVLHREMMAVVACNTFHAPPIWDVLSKMSLDNPHPKVELLHFVDIVAREYVKSFDEKKLGILSTSGERKFGIHKKILENYGITCIQTNEEEQEKLQRCIYNIKKNPIPQPDDLRVIHDILKDFLSQGANNVILGCTELSMIKTNITWQGGLIDPIEILSKKLIRMTGE
ncbi:MAG: aspartate/glutamate racemase family protein [Candidatus Nucleicultricaceae bacterium]